MERGVYFYLSFFFLFIFFPFCLKLELFELIQNDSGKVGSRRKLKKKKLAREGGTILAIRSHLISSARKNVAAAVVLFLLTWKTAFLLFRPSGYGLIANLASLIRESGEVRTTFSSVQNIVKLLLPAHSSGVHLSYVGSDGHLTNKN